VVRGLTEREIREAYEVRAELEGLAAELACERIREPELERLREAVDLFRHSSRRKIEAWVRANDQFHQIIQETAGNERLRATIGDLHLSFPRNLTSIVLRESSRLLDENVEQHGEILAAIERHDPA
jgi:DNA-binding GntR family transcriptional regulator